MEIRVLRAFFIATLSRFRRVARAAGLGNIRGTRSIYRWLRGLLISKDTLQIRCRGVWFFVNSRDEVITPCLVNDGVYERLETELFERSVRPGMVIIDVGANFGYYAMIAAKLLHGTGFVYAFEPDPKNYELLVKNTRSNGYSNVVTINKAVGESGGTARLFLNTRNLGGNSLSQHNVSSVSGDVLVEVTSLDAFVREAQLVKVDLLKIDVEGAEGTVCNGAINLLSTGCKIFMEFWPGGLRNFGTDPLDLACRLVANGYTISVINEDKRRTEKIKDENAILSLIERCKQAETEEYSKVNLFLEKAWKS